MRRRTHPEMGALTAGPDANAVPGTSNKNIWEDSHV